MISVVVTFLMLSAAQAFFERAIFSKKLAFLGLKGGRSLLIRAGSSDEGVGYLVGLEGRGGGVDPEDLKIFIQTHSSDQHPPKTANQLYDPMHLHRNGWRTTVGTLFGSKYMIRMMLWVLGTSATFFGVGWRFADAHDMSYFEHLEDALHGIITFLLGLFLSTVYNRWASLFSGPYGRVWGAITGISFYGNQYIKGPNKSKILLQNLRWGLLSHALIWKDGSKENGMQDLVERYLCTRDEAALIEKIEQRCPGASRAKIPWSWISESFTRADEQGLLHDGAMTLPEIHAKCSDAMGAIGGIMGQLNQKLPFPYVHLLTVMVKFNIGIMAVTRGIAIATHVKYGLLDEAITNLHGVMFLLIDMLRLIFLPLVYQGCFELHSLMWNPFNRAMPNNPVAFPERFYHWKILGESAALMSTPRNEFPGIQKAIQD